MNKKHIFLLLLVCLFALIAVLAYGQSSPSIRWEYSSHDLVNRNTGVWNVQRANELGQEGWELVYTQGAFSVFKRRLP